MFLSKSTPLLPHFWVGLLIICIGSLKFNSCIGDPTTSIGCLEKERKALVHLKQGLKDPSNRLSSWVGGDCCRWAGIHCNNKTGHVVKLILRGPSEIQSSSLTVAQSSDFELPCLSGEINPTLLELEYLKYLDLGTNCFGGRVIPKFLGSFKNLRYLNLAGSDFGGRVPHELGNLSSLRYLDLSVGAAVNVMKDGDHDGVFLFPTHDLYVDRLDWLSGLSSLQHLNLRSMDLSMITDWLLSINMLHSILNLHLVNCQLPNISTSLPHVNLTSLSTLDLSLNGLGPQIPTWLFNLSGLVSLDLSYNHLRFPIPVALGNLCNLKTLILWNNNLNGEINRFQESFEGCIKGNLEYLDLQSNGLSGHLPDWLGQFINLKTLILSNNSLSGSIPPSLVTLLSLEILNLDENSLSGSIPPYLGTLLSLEILNLRGNSLSGFIPPSLGSLSSLKDLILHDNKLNGSIPESFGQLSNLVLFCLANNSFDQVVLSETHFSNLTKLEVFWISSSSLVFNVSSNWVPPFQLHNIIIQDSKLGPQFPQWVQTQKKLFYLSLSNVSISDAISNFFWNLSSSIKFLDLSSNSIFGSIFDSTAAKRTNLTYLSLSSNHLSGSIPLSMCRMRRLRYLFLSDNLLTHGIPQCLWDLELETLDLRNNFLSGSIPSSISHLSWLKSLHLSNNKLSGELPPSMKNCTRLVTLDLGENGFSGKIPKWIGERLLLLKFLILRSNKFDGSLPPQLSLLYELQVLDLSQNNLSGTIPKSFGSFSAMAVANRTNVLIDISGYYGGGDLESLQVFWKGGQYVYSSTLSLVININLSGNDLHGEIPKEITNLFGLQSLNLSKNHLIGRIPENISDLRWLESLDLSWNQLSETIPHTLSYMTSLNHLNLSYNNFSGRIPSGRQLDTMNDSSIYMGNPLLCGPPLLNQCPGDETHRDSQPVVHGEEGADHEDELTIQLFYISMAPGFVVGFWVVCGTLLLKRSWRIAYYRFFDGMGNRLYVKVVRNITKVKEEEEGLPGNRGQQLHRRRVCPAVSPRH